MGQLNVVNALGLNELKAAMRSDGEYAQGFSDSFGGGYSGPAWIHRAGVLPAIPLNDIDGMRSYLAAKQLRVKSVGPSARNV